WFGIVFFLKSQLTKQMIRFVVAFAARRADHQTRQGNIVERRHVWQELEFLKQETHLLPQSSNASTVEPDQVLTVGRCWAFGRRLSPAQQLQERCLSGTARPGYENTLPFLNLETNALESCSVRR